ncbi:RNA-binding S4 domain-containing protein [Micromonospora sp. ATCC 39149]|uniref:Small ribosomal subunit protein uS4 n=1 Tax=Micromonospora carbonacea TaxID=47853 RepID=A0A7D6GPJ9_9ACTN|nr:30S ribosomal protein S4 [Micromonospora sp. ATCC 39149]EEP75274.1 RNA-binding S4 domain-containing protein [Micromonospora sp. ATCC 39149]QLK01409.1 30S ribosomal protein S4 [Micromonospora carbonacea]
MNQSRPKAKRSRRLGIALTPKCVRYLERRPFPPGDHGRARTKDSDYKVRLLEKQRLKAQYDLREGQLRRAFDRAVRRPGKTGEELVVDLETRLDALVLRAGFARTIYQARQLVTHRHLTVNGRRVDRPSARLRPGDEIAVAERSRGRAPFLLAAGGAHAPQRPAPYLDVDLAGLVARLTRPPRRVEVPVICDEQLVVEHYSR